MNERGSVFIHALSFLLNKQTPSKTLCFTCNIHTGIDDGSLRSEKVTKALLNPPIFINGNNLSINQWLSKMQEKIEINYKYYPTDQNKFNYTQNRVEINAQIYRILSIHQFDYPLYHYLKLIQPSKKYL